MFLSIIILNYKTKNLLKQCLKGIQKYPPSINYEIIVVDNDSQDGSCEMMQSEYEHIKLITSRTNVGHAAGNNLGILEAKGDYFLLLNTDIVVLDNSIDRLYNFMINNSHIGIAGAKLLNPDRSLQFSCLRFPTLLTPFCRRTFADIFKFSHKELNRYLMKDFDHQHARRVDWLISSCLMISRKCVDKIGLMDARYFVYFSDTDWCKSAWQSGFEVWYNSDVSFVHYYKRESAISPFLFFKKIVRIHIRDWIKYILKWKLFIYGQRSITN